MLKSLLHACCPPILWNGLKYALPSLSAPTPRAYQGVISHHAMQGMHSGRFADIYERAARFDPYHDSNVLRLRIYFLCLLAFLVKGIEGDFLTAGVSYGIAPRTMYEFIRFPTLGKTWHFVDPFTGCDASGGQEPTYNTDIEFVKRQYSHTAPVVFHQSRVPECLPLPGVRLAFAHLDVTDPISESNALPLVFSQLTPGGIIVIDYYAYGKGQQSFYASALKTLKAEMFTLVTGQGVLVKSL